MAGINTARRGDDALGTPIRNGRFWPFLSGLHQPRNVRIRIGFGQIWLKMYAKRIGVKNTRTFFFTLQLGRVGQSFSYGVVGFHCSKGAGAGPIPCLQRPTERFLYSGRIGVHWRPKVSVLKEDRSWAIFSNFSGSEFHQDSPSYTATSNVPRNIG